MDGLISILPLGYLSKNAQKKNEEHEIMLRLHILKLIASFLMLHCCISVNHGLRTEEETMPVEGRP